MKIKYHEDDLHDFKNVFRRYSAHACEESMHSFRRTRYWRNRRYRPDVELHMLSAEGDPRDYTLPLQEIFKSASKECQFISVDPEVMAGAPCISGTRIPVYGILDALEQHGSVEGVLE